MSKTVGILYCLNEREFIKQQIDSILKVVDLLIIRMGSMRITHWFAENNISTDGTKEFIEEYTKNCDYYKTNDKACSHCEYIDYDSDDLCSRRPGENKIIFDYGLYYDNLFDSMKPSGFSRAAEFCDDEDIIIEWCSNEFYNIEDLKKNIQDIKDNKIQGNVFCVEFFHLYKLMRWGFKMSREHRIVKYKKGMYMDGQSKVMLNGQLQNPVNLDLTCYHACPLKATSNIWKYINKYVGYSMRGKKSTIPDISDVKWAINVLVDEGYLVPNEFIELEMQKPPAYGIFMAKEYFGPWPEELKDHQRWNEEVYNYYTKKGYKYEQGIFVK